MKTSRFEIIIGLFNVKLKYQDFNQIFFHRKFAKNRNELFYNMLSTVNFNITIIIMHAIGWENISFQSEDFSMIGHR